MIKPVAVVSRLSGIAVVVAALCCADSALADTVRGSCSYRGVTYTFIDAAVVKEPNTFDAARIETVVVLTTYPIDKNALAGAAEKTDLIAEQGYMIDESRRLELRLSGGKAVTVNFNGAGSSVSQSGGDIGKLTTQVNDAKRMAGSFVLEGDDDVRCDVGFDLAYAATTAATAAASAAGSKEAAPKGKALPAGGGEAGKVFQANLAAMQKGDLDAMLATVTKKQADEIRAQRKDPQFGAMLEMMKAFAPKSAAVTGGQDFGDSAELTLDAVDQSGGKSTGTATMRKEGGAWKVEKTRMKSGI
ncbi:MAG: hypothetical protein JNN30_17380 [Rhodanobacteraceae bacterium]|nr:hypothetical protein [Rhodanobacteraceae bacterium]